MGQTHKGLLTASMILTLLTASPVFAAEAPPPPASGSSDIEVQVHPGYTLSAAAAEHADTPAGLAKQARSAVLMDDATGKVLYEKDAHEKLPMASITKVMTLLLIMEALDDGRLKLTDPIKTSEYAASMGGSQIFLEPGETMSAQDMIKGIAVASANDACVAMAEHLSGSEENFVRQMNERAKELGMDDTHFVNCNGLPAPNHYSSAHDIAIMSRELLKHQEITKWTSVYSDYLRKDSDHPLWLVNTNKLVRFYDGADGLKTGYTAEAKYCLSATAKRNGFRVIAVVMGEPKPTVRNAEVSGMLNWAFSHYRSKVLYQEGQVIADNVRVTRGTPEKIPVVAGDTVGVVYKAGAHPAIRTKVELFQLSAPVKSGQRVGTLKVYEGEDLVSETPILAGTSVERAGFMQSVGRTMRDLITFGKGS
ncbi:D-alanyl-D-alanine carboxypeptidase family protein [Alicyclobacillus cycloheptanicus]|uniref:serine-type D-Ala-D-Ala carboxypeptidase n=1 Tax=Alicyclobacillus cycloheptanicus TaxID=1457 RepID=A0ABT9XE29_9BACL|nr:D-alanyl-D-alanine carboxypeptidase family protein [Alicyclobacillus cycloheptanicus]MDQ0188432.1 D-alanyl-D-alanine carboxypeptidase (penicillin-binding protein 5/6) [Alicyclobacillus cycloheptanicus]